MAEMMEVWQPDGSVTRQEVITSNEAHAGNLVAEGRLEPDAYWESVAKAYRAQLAAKQREHVRVVENLMGLIRRG